MFTKLALRNVKRQIGSYLIYFVTIALTVSVVFSVNNLIFGDVMDDFEIYGVPPSQLKLLLATAVVIICFIIAFVLSYATNFLLTRRKKEFGLYLTMGMTRGNIITLFMAETAVTFVISVAAGLVLGLGVYQLFLLAVSNFMRIDFSTRAYSVAGTAVTVIMVGGLYAFASLVSLLELKYTKIANLLHAEKVVEKAVARPIPWAVLCICALAGIVISIAAVVSLFAAFKSLYDIIGTLFLIITLCCVCVFLLYIGAVKCLTPLLIKNRRFSSKGTRIFTLRQLSGRLNANASMLGALAMLLAFTFIGLNALTLSVSILDSDINRSHSFDIQAVYDRQTDYAFSLDEGLEIIEEYASVKEIYRFLLPIMENVQLSNKIFPHNSSPGDLFMAESDYRALCSAIGEKAAPLGGGFLILPRDRGYAQDILERREYEGLELTIGEETYHCTGAVSYSGSLLVGTFMNNSFCAVVPDAVAAEIAALSAGGYNCMYVMLNSLRYNTEALCDALKEKDPNPTDVLTWNRYYQRESWRRYLMSTMAGLFIAVAVLAVAFLLLAVAVLSLKMLSSLAEDKNRFKALWRLGADEGMLRRSLLSQRFLFFALPFLVPLLLSVPVGFLYPVVASPFNVPFTFSFVLGKVGAIVGILFALYLLYFAVVFLVAWRDIKSYTVLNA